MATELTHQQLVELLEYCPVRGALLWRKGRKLAGCVTEAGYVRIQVLGRNYLAHRLVWLWVTGMQPQGVVHHKNNVRHNNTFFNLMDVPAAVNNAAANRLPAKRGRVAALYA